VERSPTIEARKLAPLALEGRDGVGVGRVNKLDVIAPTSVKGGRLHESTPHDSASKQVAGRAEYVDDLTEPEGTLHAYLGLSTHAHAQIASLDLDAVRGAPGVIGVLILDQAWRHDDPGAKAADRLGEANGMSGAICIPKGLPRAIPIRTASSCGRGVRSPRARASS